MLEIIEKVLAVLVIIWALYCFYLTFKKYDEEDDPLLGLCTLTIFDLIVMAIEWIGEKFSELVQIIVFKVFTFLFGVILLGAAYVLLFIDPPIY